MATTQSPATTVPATPAPIPWTPSVSPWLIAATVMLATFMEVLDTSIANVSLPHIAGSLSATVDESTWVLTSYLISNAIVLPRLTWTAFHGTDAEYGLTEYYAGPVAGQMDAHGMAILGLRAEAYLLDQL